MSSSTSTSPIFELVVAVDQPDPLVRVVDGRLPRPCADGTACEAMLLSETEPDVDFSTAHPSADLQLTIVGRGIIDPAVPFGDLDQRGPFGEATIGGGDYQTGRRSPAVLLVNGVDTVSHAPAFDLTGRTYVWTAPVDVAAIHPWTAGAFRDAVEEMTRGLLAADPAYSVESPLTQISGALALADASSARLLLIGSLGVAILLAFAVFLALVVRDDVAAEVARLIAVGARRRDRVAFLVLEAGIPAVIGGVIGWFGGALVVAFLAGWAGADAHRDRHGRDPRPGFARGGVPGDPRRCHDDGPGDSAGTVMGRGHPDGRGGRPDGHRHPRLATRVDGPARHRPPWLAR